MKILHIINSLRSAGAEVMLTDICPKLVAQGHYVRVYSLAAGDPNLISKMVAGGVDLIVGDADTPYLIRNLFKIYRELTLNKYDVIHVHLFPAQLYVALIARIANLENIITTEHNTNNRRRKSLIFKHLDRIIYSKYTKIICISEATKKSFDNWLPCYIAKSVVIENGIDFARFMTPLRNRSEPQNDLVKIISIGRLEEQKNFSVAIHAMTILSGCTLTIVGDGSLRRNLEELAIEIGVREKIEFLGLRSDIPELLQMSDIYIQTSLWEGFGIAAVEAMACGLPVIVSDVPGLSDVVGNAGLKFASGDYMSLAIQLQKVIKNSALKDHLCKEGKARANKYSIDITIDKYVELYKGLHLNHGC